MGNGEQPLIDEYNYFYFQKRREKYYQQHKKEINYYCKLAFVKKGTELCGYCQT